MASDAARAINGILWAVWDPIGSGVPEDEYESYVEPIERLLRAGASRDELAAYLRFVATELMGIGSPERRANLAIDQLLALALP